jgi:hypothetical protein
MELLTGSVHPSDVQNRLEVASEFADRHFATVARREMVEAGIGRGQIETWIRVGRLHPRYPGVYAWGRPDLSVEGELAAGLLYAGKGSALTGLTMLWWRELLGRRPDRIHIDAPRDVASIDDLAIRHPGRISRSLHKGLPLAALPDALPVAAADLSFDSLRLVIARAEFHRVCSLAEIEAGLGHGRRGAAAVRHALSRHLPQLAKCVNRYERAFVLLCEAGSVEIPEPNPRIGRFRPDMLWERQGLIVELDGPHHLTAARQIDDAKRQRYLESLGYRVLRFTHEEVELDGERVLAVVRAALSA